MSRDWHDVLPSGDPCRTGYPSPVSGAEVMRRIAERPPTLAERIRALVDRYADDVDRRGRPERFARDELVADLLTAIDEETDPCAD